MEIESEFVDVPYQIKGHVIGKNGSMIHKIEEMSGARVNSKSKEEEGFIVSGNEEQRAKAKMLILQKVQAIEQREQEDYLSGELVEVPDEYKGLVIGKGGETLAKLSKKTGSKVIRKKGEVYIVSGTEEQRRQAKVLIKIMIAGARVRGVENKFNKVCCYIDGWNLPKGCKLKLEQPVKLDRMVLLGLDAQYRLKPAEHYEPQEPYSPSDDPTYLLKLENDALESLRKIKHEIETKKYLKADMWCHFGTAIIRGPDEEGSAGREWTIDEATKMLQPSKEGNNLKAAFKEGVNFEEKILERNACGQKHEEYEDYSSRYDFTFLTPCSHEMRFKVWVIKKNTGKKLEDIPSPFTDVKNIFDEVKFEDELTQSRCRGWLVAPSRRYLQADILFPGCKFDCRLTIRGRTGMTIHKY